MSSSDESCNSSHILTYRWRTDELSLFGLSVWEKDQCPVFIKSFVTFNPYLNLTNHHERVDKRQPVCPEALFLDVAMGDMIPQTED